MVKLLYLDPVTHTIKTIDSSAVGGGGVGSGPTTTNPFSQTVDNTVGDSTVLLDVVTPFYSYRALASSDFNGKVVIQAENEASEWVVLDTFEFGSSVFISGNPNDWADGGFDASKQLAYPFHIQILVITQCTTGTLDIKASYLTNT